ncbi:hypothetical protein BC835DRAFT_1412571 [Cytidiella melzeri]|nr:hypothetical protein BC835DRAFT_1412571 [Cytidiella melzeri]
MSERQKTTTEARLPTELLLIVKEFIPLFDLRTHVCFYNTCRTTASFYGNNSEQAAFWRRVCALSGIGWLKADSSWKEIAFETIVKDGFCSHPHCGGTLLDWNATRVANAMRLYDWDPEEGAWDAAFDEHAVEWTREDRPVLVCSSIFRHIRFSDNALPPWYMAMTDPRLHTDADAPAPSQSWIAAHPVASRSFATFPTVRRMRFHYNNYTYGNKADSAMGVTVWDVLRSIQVDLDFELTIRELIDLVTGPFAEVFRDRPSSSLASDLQRFSTLRGLWSVGRWDGLHFVRSDGDGPVFRSTFSSLAAEEHERAQTASELPELHSQPMEVEYAEE